MPSVSALPGSGPIYGTGTSDYSKKQNVTKAFKDPGYYIEGFHKGLPKFGQKTLGYGYAGDAQLNAYVDSLKPSGSMYPQGGFGYLNNIQDRGNVMYQQQLDFAKNKAQFYSMIKNNPNMTYNTQASNTKSYLGKALYKMLMANGIKGFGLFNI